jgi:polysaccharide pyruvyl transferase CsaB
VKRGTRVVLAGYYGFDNAGDEAILAAILADLRALDAGLAATVLAEDTAGTSVAHGVTAVHWRDIDGITAAVQACDLVIVGGGGLFQDTLAFDPAAMLTARHHGISYYGGIPFLAERLGKPCALYAVGVGPLTTEAGREGTRAAFARAALITVRDHDSKRILVEIGIDAARVRVTADPAFRLARASPTRAAEILKAAGLDTSARPRLGIALRHWDIGVEAAQWEEQVAAAIDAFLEGHAGVAVFVPFQSLGEELVDDVGVARRVRARMKHAGRATILDGRLPPAGKAGVLAGCDVVLGMRLHSLIFAMSAGVASIALAYDPKVQAVMAEAGAPEQVVPLEGLRAERLASALADAYARRAAIGARLAAAGARLAGRAGDTAPLALALVPTPRTVSPLLHALHRLRLVMAPPGSRRERAWRRGFAGFAAPPPTPVVDVIRDPMTALAGRIRKAGVAVVFPPSIGWKIDLIQRPHHLARAFVRAGGVAVFDSTGSHDGVTGLEEIEPGVFLYGGPHDALGALPDTVLWTFPYNFHFREHHPRGTPVVYDWIDDLDVFPQERALLERNHAAALREATVVASVARTLDAEARRTRPDALYLPNAVDLAHFTRADDGPLEDPEMSAILETGRPIAGYYGALARWFDYALLDQAAALRPGWTFLLIGPDLDGSMTGKPALARPNVKWLGPRPYAALPRYLRRFDVATIPFAINPITVSTSPLKLFEYFAGGKPVVTTPMPECAAFPDVRIAATAEAFAEALDAARRDGADPAFRERVRAVARDNSWDARVRDARAALDRGKRPREAASYTDRHR